MLLLLLCSVEELLNLVIPVKSSTDLDMDPCKSDRFDGKTLASHKKFKEGPLQVVKI
jgi:hypothetical protein